jgi:hypothetical protein
MRLAVLALCVSALEPMGGERQASVTLGLAAYSSQPSLVGFSESARVRIDAVWISIQTLQLRPASTCKRSDAKLLVRGAVTAELVRRKVTGLPTAMKIDPGRYCAFEVELRRSEGRVASAMRGASIVVQARRADGVRVIVRSRLGASPLLRAHDLQGFAIDEPGVRWVLAVDIARWMAAVDLALADVGTDGVIRIDDKHNAELLSKFDANVEGGFALFDDKDGNRALDSNEQKPIASGRCNS